MQNKKYNNFYNQLEAKNIAVLGTIVSDVKESEYDYSCKVKVRTINNNKYNNIILNLDIKKTKGTKVKELKYGDLVKIKGIYNSPNQRKNYKGFNYREYLKTKKTYGMIESKFNQIEVLKKNTGNPLFIASNWIRNKIIEAGNETLSEETAALINGILIGYKEDMSEDMIESFKDSGLSHVLAVSGLHVAYIVLIIKNTFDRMKRVSQKTKSYFTILFLIIFMFITEFAASVVRACIMAILLSISNLVHRKSNLFHTLNIALLITLLYNPFLLTDIGLLLSYGGTLGIFVLNQKVQKVCNNILGKKLIENKLINKIKEIFVVSFSVQIIIFPIMMIYFNVISLNFFISNALIEPIIAPITIIGFVNVIKFPPISFILEILLKLLILISNFCAAIPFSNLIVTTPNIMLVISYYILIYCIFFHFKKFKNFMYNRKKTIIKLIVIGIMITIIYRNVPKDLRIYFIDVGQGDSTLIITPTNKKILFDGGGNRNMDGFDVGEKVVVPYLLDRGIKTLDMVIISHFDADHCNGLIYVIENLNIKKIVFSKQTEESNEYNYILDIIKERKIPIQLVKEGDKIVLDKYSYFDILAPNFTLSEKDLNNNSIVAKLKYYNFSMLFTRRHRRRGRKTPYKGKFRFEI